MHFLTIIVPTVILSRPRLKRVFFIIFGYHTIVILTKISKKYLHFLGIILDRFLLGYDVSTHFKDF